MEESKMMFIMFIVLLIGFFTFVFGTIAIIQWDSSNRVNQYRTRLQDAGFTIVNAKIDSPSVIIQLSTDNFLVKAKALKVSTIYLYSGDFYIFEPNLLIAYSTEP